jgi:RNA polymerase sigma-70 factor (ECF subfamily)
MHRPRHTAWNTSVEATFRAESPRALATLIRLLGDMDLAEEAVQDAFVIALERWPTQGVPDNPGAWITTTARNRALDRVRREAKRDGKQEEAHAHLSLARAWAPAAPTAGTAIDDDRLRLVFTCCHPVLPLDAQVALALRTLCGLSTVEVARAFSVPETTMQQRIVRAKKRIAAAKIPYRVPGDAELPDRLAGALGVVNAVFTAGYNPTGDDLVRVDLCAEGLRLARLLAELMPDEPEVLGLLALLLFTEARRGARVDATGEVVLLADQDRRLWDRGMIDEGVALVDAALRRGRAGPYQLQAAISACHATAPSAAETDWSEIASLYRVLADRDPTPAVLLNEAVAIAEVDGAEAGLSALDSVDGLHGHHLFHAVRADLLRRIGRDADAAAAYRDALQCEPSAPEERFLRDRLASLGAADAV